MIIAGEITGMVDADDITLGVTDYGFLVLRQHGETIGFPQADLPRLIALLEDQARFLP